MFWEKNLKIYWLFFNSRWSIPEVEVCFPSSSKLNAPIFHLGMTFLFFCIARILFCKVKIEMKFFEVLVGAVEGIFCVRTERTFKHLNIWSPSDFPKHTSKCGKSQKSRRASSLQGAAQCEGQLSVFLHSTCQKISLLGHKVCI